MKKDVKQSDFKLHQFYIHFNQHTEEIMYNINWRWPHHLQWEIRVQYRRMDAPRNKRFGSTQQ